MQGTLFERPVLHPDKLIKTSHEMLDAAMDEYRPDRVLVLFSGGDDSLLTTYVATQHAAVDGVLHIRTGIGIGRTLEYVRDTCATYDWPLGIYEPLGTDNNLNYEQMVLKYGFPGPGAHRFPYSWLKERQIRRVERELREQGGKRIMLITGVRSSESARRMGHVQPFKREGNRVWSAPLHDWTDGDVERAKVIYSLPTNPVKAIMKFSGECVCGAFAGQRHGSREAELEAIDRCDPECAHRIVSLQNRLSGTDIHATWGVRPPARMMDAHPDQMSLLDHMPLCSGCIFKTPPTI